MSVRHLAIQPPVQLSAVTRLSREARRRSPRAWAWAYSCALVGIVIDAGHDGETSVVAQTPAAVSTARARTCHRGRPAPADPRWRRAPPGACAASASVAHAQGHAVQARRAEEGVPRACLDRRIDADLLVGLVGQVLAPEFQHPALVAGTEAQARIGQGEGILCLLRVQVRAG